MAALKNDLETIDGLGEAAVSKKQHNLQNQGVEALKDVVYGSTAGILGKFIEYPFDTVKVRLQSQPTVPGQPVLSGPLDAFVAAFRSPEGPLRSLYRGISAPLVGAAVETSSLFFSYRVAQDIVIAATPALRKQKELEVGKIQLPFMYLVACGAASGAFTSLALTPIELIKCKMQVPITPSHIASDLGYTVSKPPGIIQLVSNVFRTHGLLGFWHGQLGTLIRETGGSAAWFGSYEGIKLIYLQYDSTVNKIEDVKVWQQMSAGAVAGMAYNFAFYPADTIKSRMQTEEVGATKSKGTFLGTGKALWGEAGIRGFYRGCGITVFRAAPSSAIIFSIYEGLRKYFG
jgi:mitochondrial ornithine carrier protein